MDERRNAVIVADESGDVEAVHAAVVELNKFVSHHMNTSLGGGIALQNTYDLAVQAALDAAKTPNVDSSAYAYATEACKPKIAIGGYQMYAQCVSDIVGSTPSENFRDPVLPNPASYYVRIAPPVWSFDLAGISILICLLIIFAIAVRVVTAVILRLILKFRYRST